MKKLYVCVEVYGLIVQDVHVFWSEELADDWFKNYTGASEYPKDDDAYSEFIEEFHDYDQTKIFIVEV